MSGIIALMPVAEHLGGKWIYYRTLRASLAKTNRSTIEIPLARYPKFCLGRILAFASSGGINDRYYSRIARLSISFQARQVNFIADSAPTAPQVIHTQDPFSSASLFRSKWANIPVVQTIHSLWLEESLANGIRQGSQYFRYLSTIQDEACRKTSLFIALNSKQVDWLHSQNVEESRIAYIPNAVDVDFLNSSLQPSHLSRPYIAMACRLSPEKGVEIAIRAIGKIALAHKPKLYIVGGGPLEPKLRELVSRDGLDDFIHFLGQQSHEKTVGILKGASLSLCPSMPHGGIEDSAPLSILESMAVGTPVIASRIGGIPEYIKDGYSGFLCTPGSATELAAKIRQFHLLSAQERSQLSDRAQADARSHFGIEIWTEKVLESYSRVQQILN